MLITSGTQQAVVHHQYDTVDTVYWSMSAFKVDDGCGTQYAGDMESQLNPVGQTQLITTGLVVGGHLPVVCSILKGRMPARDIGLQSDIRRFSFECGSPD